MHKGKDIYSSPRYIKQLKHLGVFCLTVLCCVVLNVIAYGASSKEVKVGLFEFKPISFINEENQPAGIYVDLINSIAKTENWHVTYVFGTWDEGLTSVKNGDIDLMISIAKTPEREKFIDFSHEAVATLWGEVYAREKSGIKSIIDLQGKHVAIMKGDINGTNFQDTARTFDINCIFIELPTLDDVLHAIENKSVDAGVLPNLFGIANHGQGCTVKTSIMFNAFSIYFGVPKGTNEALLTTIDSYLHNWKTNQNSYYNDRLDFWFGTEQYDKKTIANGLIISVIILISLAIIFAVWIQFLHTKVGTKNKDLQKSKERYESIFNSTSDAIFIHDETTGEILDINDSTLSMFQCTREEALQYFKLLTQKAESPYSAKEAAAHMKRAANGEKQLFEWKSWKKDGTCFWCEVSLRVDVINQQKVVIAVVRDIEERKQLEDQLRHAHRMEAIGTLAGGIAHDFNNILTGIFGYTELSQLNINDPQKLEEYLQEIHTSAHRAKKLIQQIQTFSRKNDIEKKPLQPSIIVMEVIKLLSSSIPTSISINCDLQSTSLILADQTQMHQVILNLCTNSYHAIEESKGAITIRLKDTNLNIPHMMNNKHLEAGKYVVLTVSDTGHGIPPETLNSIFDPYFTTKTQDKGTGLGLAVVQGIVQTHGGGINVQSEVGKGTTFSIYLPIIQPKEKDSVILPVDEKLIGGNETILVVDDEAPIVKAVSSILREFGYTAHTFTSPTDALMAFMEDPNKYDLILSDMTMPELTGADLATQILQKKPDMPIIIATGNTEIINKKNAKKLGISAYCAKPVSMPTLLTAVRKALDT